MSLVPQDYGQSLTMTEKEEEREGDGDREREIPTLPIATDMAI